MKKMQGIGVSPGVTIGKVLVVDFREFAVPKYEIKDQDILSEISRFEDALTKTRSEILGIRRQLAQKLKGDHAEIFSAHLLILEDRTLIEQVLKRLKEEHFNVEYIFSNEIENYVKAFSQIDDKYIRERADDIKDVAQRFLHNMLGEPRTVLANLKEKVIIVAHDLSPSDVAMFNKNYVIGVATDVGGPTSHTAILARSLEIPAVVGLNRATLEITNEDHVIIDGTSGQVIINPDADTIRHFETEEKHFVDTQHRLETLRDLPAVTLDGKQLKLLANIEYPEEIPSVKSHGAEGIGLYRTEYLFINRPDLPTEEEQYEAYVKVAKTMTSQEVVIRTLDLGGDKFLSSMESSPEMNPFLGWRAIRFCLARQDIFKTQFRAILRASAHGHLKVMYPMISNVGELRQANLLLRETMQELKKENINYDEKIQIGAMIEIPSAALTSDILAKEANFFSIGTNDLIQYALAVDRVNEKIAYLYQPTHPAILRLIKHVIEAGHEAGIRVSMCGEMSADPALAMILLGFGIDELSTSPFLIPKIKKVVRSITSKQAEEIAQHCLSLSTGEEIRVFVDKKLNELVPDLM
jgi:phosphotransferase system enzyme I (PtsI)